jgi:hypothetical protein
MVLTPGQQKAVFVLVVVVLAAFGYFVVVPALHHKPAPGQAAATPAPAASPSALAPQSTPASPVTATSATAGGVDIYSWLPFTRQDLASAAAVTVRFTSDYNTFSYTEKPAAYVAAMHGLITGQLATTLEAAYSVPGVAQLRNQQKQVSTGTAVINSLRAFGPSSMTFVVTATQHLVTTKGTSNGSTQWAVTVTGSGSSWLVSDIEPKGAGNT